ncbi:hypothetical protein FPV67DRAFT_1456587 [Lyophyllum atratum]|nr:hypothetical protein FPV67DRAFT_1456587 [Lyophyllum atratum]
MVRIRSEHAIGFLKGRFQSLKGLQINIKSEATHKFATYWVLEECGRLSAEETDPFVAEGLSSSASSSDSRLPPPPPQIGRGVPRSLHAAKARRERLKAQLFRAKERQASHRQRRHDEGQSSEDTCLPRSIIALPSATLFACMIQLRDARWGVLVKELMAFGFYDHKESIEAS